MQITVIGAGVIGLSTALTLQARGHAVRVWARARGEATTSAVAGAIWFPYRCGPIDRVQAWGARTLARLRALANDTPAAGVRIVDLYELRGDDPISQARPWWAEGIDVVATVAPIAGAPAAWHLRAPCVEPAIYLPWLEAQLARPIEHHVVRALAEVPGDRVINCTGLGARALVGDAALVPLQGQVLIALAGAHGLAQALGDHRHEAVPFYSIPRATTLILGGTSDAVEVDTTEPGPPDPAVRARLLATAAGFGVPVGEVLHERVGLRPSRPDVRLEIDADDPRILHHYGHGGAGYTLSWGCAEAVADLVEGPHDGPIAR